MPDRESQRPCATSPSNIDLSATSMLIPHSNSRSSCGGPCFRSRGDPMESRGDRGQSIRLSRVSRNSSSRTRDRRRTLYIAFRMQGEKFDTWQAPRHTYLGPPPSHDALSGPVPLPSFSLTPLYPYPTRATSIEMCGIFSDSRNERRSTSLMT